MPLSNKPKKTAKPEDKNLSVVQEAFINAGIPRYFKTFPIQILKTDLQKINSCRENRRQSTGRSITTHDWILEAIADKLYEELEKHQTN